MPETPPTSMPSPRKPSPDRVRRMFGEITPAYDRLNFLFSATLDRRWRRRAAREALGGLRPCAHALDIATGDGDLAATLAHVAQGPMTVIGLDFTRAMLTRARQKYDALPIRWIEADGIRLPLADGAVDAVTIAFGLRNMTDRAGALREMTRVARPGGRVAILEFGQPRGRVLRAFYDFYALRIMPRIGRWISGSDAYAYLARSTRAFWSADRLADEMRRAGLTAIRVIPILRGIVYLHVGEKQAAS